MIKKQASNYHVLALYMKGFAELSRIDFNEDSGSTSSHRPSAEISLEGELCLKF